MPDDINALFLHYGIRDADMATIAQICKESDVDFEWLKENILKVYHQKQTDKDLTETRIKRIVSNALDNLPQ